MQDGKLVGRFTITHKDGEPIEPESGEYFVLNLKKAKAGIDQRSFSAIRAYILACKISGYPELANDIERILGVRFPSSQPDEQPDDWYHFLDVCLTIPLGDFCSLADFGLIGELGSRILNIRDTENHLSEILGEIWALIYHGDTESWEYPGQILNHIRVELEALQKQIDELKSQSRWIPVSERLPPYEERVLVVVEGVSESGDGIWCQAEVYGTHETDYLHKPTDTIFTDHWETWGEGLDYERPITHWMPLPTPPKPYEASNE